MRYETWAFERIKGKPKCSVEPSMTCIPLRDDPICRACYEGENVPTTLTPKETSIPSKKGSHIFPPLEKGPACPVGRDGGGFRKKP